MRSSAGNKLSLTVLIPDAHAESSGFRLGFRPEQISDGQNKGSSRISMDEGQYLHVSTEISLTIEGKLTAINWYLTPECIPPLQSRSSSLILRNGRGPSACTCCRSLTASG
jgi:hypothetical protein